VFPEAAILEAVILEAAILDAAVFWPVSFDQRSAFSCNTLTAWRHGYLVRVSKLT